MWSSATDILSFCWEHLLYFCLQAKHKMFFSSRTQTNIFLHNILHSEYADMVTTFQSHVKGYHSEDDDGYLPSNLCINGIATAIHLNASARARDVGLGSPRVHRIQGDLCFDHHLGRRRSSHNVSYKDTPLGHFGWIRGVPMTVVSTDAAPSNAVPRPPVADVTIGMLGIVPTLLLGTA